MIECAVIEAGNSRETLISIQYLKKWNLLHPTFPLESIDNFVERKAKDNKYSALYTSLSNEIEASLYQESMGLRELSKACKSLREDTLKKWNKCFKEVLTKEDRINHPPVKIKLKENTEIHHHIVFAPTILLFTSAKCMKMN